MVKMVVMKCGSDVCRLVRKRMTEMWIKSPMHQDHLAAGLCTPLDLSADFTGKKRGEGWKRGRTPQFFGRSCAPSDEQRDIIEDVTSKNIVRRCVATSN